MTIPAATPDMPRVEVSHGVGALVLALRDDTGRSLGTVLNPDGADDLADELHHQASEARRLLATYHPPSDGETKRPHLLVLALLVTLIVGGLLVGALAAWG